MTGIASAFAPVTYALRPEEAQAAASDARAEFAALIDAGVTPEGAALAKLDELSDEMPSGLFAQMLALFDSMTEEQHQAFEDGRLQLALQIDPCPTDGRAN